MFKQLNRQQLKMNKNILEITLCLINNNNIIYYAEALVLLEKIKNN